MMDFERVSFSIQRLNKDSMEKGNIRLQHLTGQINSILQSDLFARCYDIVNVIHFHPVTDDLDAFIPNANINETQTGLPPFSMEQLKKRIVNLHLPYGTSVFSLQLPNYQPRFGYRRSGIVLRQAVIKGEVESLFIAGVEHGSPASNAVDLHMGDCIYAISGYPLDWHTLEQLRHKLIELDGLSPNSNIYDLATYLLNRPYQNIGVPGDHHGLHNNGMFKVTSDIPDSVTLEPPVLVLFRYPKTNLSWSNEVKRNEITEPKNVVKKGEVRYYETVLENSSDDTGLGLQIGCDQDEKGILIVSIFKNSQAERDGVLREGDHIVEVNYQNLEGLEAKQALKKVKSICRNAKFVHIKCSRNLKTDDYEFMFPCDNEEKQSEDRDVVNDSSQEMISTEDCNKGDSTERDAVTSPDPPEKSLHSLQSGSVSPADSNYNELSKNSQEYKSVMDTDDDENILIKWMDMFDPDVKILEKRWVERYGIFQSKVMHDLDTKQPKLSSTKQKLNN
ncbi:unnamed protein product [Heterobilharzia americana]|nr:unnamed protein product [Heterobilharzia americana]